jgi:carbon storage regulator
MLILTRSVNQSIIIDENITFKILAINGRQIKLGILAPDNLDIRRDEIDPETKKKSHRTPAINLPLV